MTAPLYEWAARHGIPPQALQELLGLLGIGYRPALPGGDPNGEAAVQAAVRLEAARRGMILWRNNSGMAYNENGTPIRFGLANDSAQQNHVFKSSDLIGIAADGRFCALECKRPGWIFTGTDRERAQLAFIQFIAARGGLAKFITNVEEL